MLVVLSIALVGRINDVLALLVYSPCGWFFFFFCLDTKEEEPRRKNQGYVSGPTAERSFFYSGFLCAKTLRCWLLVAALLFLSLCFCCYFHKDSFSQPWGNPMACKSTLGYSAKSLSKELFKSMQGVIFCSKYNKVHNWWYSLIGFRLGAIQFKGSRFGNWGFKAKRLFHIRAWWAQQLRSTVMHLIQLSKYVYWGRPNSLATCFFNRLSLNR